jgi:hypothetical protein
MAYEVSISLSGTNLDAKTFLDAAQSFLRLLGLVDETISQKRSIRWRLSRLHFGSPATIGVMGEPRRRASQDAPQIIGGAVLAGLEMLENGDRPITFPDEALEAAKSLSSLRERRGIDWVSLSEQNGAAPKTLTISARTAATVVEYIGPRFESFGSVEGRLEVISARGGVSCNVYEPVFGKAVKCEVPEHLKSVVLAAFEKKVVASGRLGRDSSGQPRRLVLESIDVPDQTTETPISSILGLAPDFTDGEDTAEWLKKRWQ